MVIESRVVQFLIQIVLTIKYQSWFYCRSSWRLIYLCFNKLVPGKPEVTVEQPKETVVVSWTLKEKNGVIKEYRVTYVNEDDASETKTLTTKKMEAQFDLKAGKTYKFQVGQTFSKVWMNLSISRICFLCSWGRNLLDKCFTITFLGICYKRHWKGPCWDQDVHAEKRLVCSSSLSQSAVRLTLSNYQLVYLSFHIFFPTIPVSEVEKLKLNKSLFKF